VIRILAIIPARLASTRFPAKALADIAGKSMIRRVYEQAKKSSRLSDIIVATDHQSIYDHVIAFGGAACMTSDNHPSGTDRCYEALTKQPDAFDYVINVQGDEPFIAPEQIDLLASLLDGKVELATLIKTIQDEEQLFNPNLVRVVVTKHNEAIYFTRSTIPYLRNVPQKEWFAKHTYFKHIGMYAYRADVLKKITRLEISSLEKAESLEQLRWIENGFKIKVAVTNLETIGIDTPEDIAKAVAFLKTISSGAASPGQISQSPVAPT
jgi:3-deoxy-manno-octulosonate cytidylyltransferase (CMP-KDO synthetase)